MSIVFKTITLRNFLSIGAVQQSVNLDSKELSLILGENLDLGGAGARNGVGKSSLFQALSYVIFGSPINNIRKDNLINRTNGKNMMVTLDFSVDGVEYRIERGRRPNTLKFYVNSNLQNVTDDAQGENRATQDQIERAIGMSADMFKHIVALNTYTEPFLAMNSNDQRKIIEQLLGITLLSEKADLIKEKVRLTKENIQLEEFSIRAIEEANKRVQEQIESLKRRQRLWIAKHTEDLTNLVNDYDELSKINIDSELQAHKDLAVYDDNKKKLERYNSVLARQSAWAQKKAADLAELQKTLDRKSHIDIETELKAHNDLITYNIQKSELDTLVKTIASLEQSYEREQLVIDKLTSEVKDLEQNKCYACGQDFHDEGHYSVLTKKKELLVEAQSTLAQTHLSLEKNKNSMFILGKLPITHYRTQAEAIRHSSDIENIQKLIDTKNAEADPYIDQLALDYCDVVLGPAPITHYDTEAQAIEHRSTVSTLSQLIENKANEADPYSEQVDDMEKKAIQTVSFDKINEMSRLIDHLKFLLDLLTSKDSFVRKKIIDQSLSYLNTRLTGYLDKIGLPHNVIFKNDLSVEITELGRELDFYNLSRGEMNRVILALSWAFRDVWENLYSSINVMMIDELLDNGTDAAGVEHAFGVIKNMSRDRGKSIWLVSHKEDLIHRVPSVLTAIKENGFTRYEDSELDKEA